MITASVTASAAEIWSTICPANVTLMGIHHEFFVSLGSRFICKYAPKYFPITVVFEDEGHLNSDGCYGEFGTACTFAARMSLLMAIYIFQFCKLFHSSACRIMPICSERKNLYMPTECSLLHGLHSTNRRLGPVSPFLEAQRWMSKLTTPHDSKQ
jgi:hypothetical protein